MRLHVKTGLAVALAAATLLTTACGTGNNPPATPTDGDTGAATDVTLTWWHNANTDPGLTFWSDTAKAYDAAHPGVKINIQVYQNEDLRARLKTVFSSDQAPNIFQQWGGGELADQVSAGYVQDITDKAADAIASLGGAGSISGWTVDGKVYGLPYTLGIEGIYYNKDLFTQAGISSIPTTMAELNDAVAKLKAAGIQPIAVGGKDAWPAAHWYFNFALRECTLDVMNATVKSLQFTDACWQKAAQDLADFTATNPFNDGWSTTSAQNGAGSSAGMLANGQAAMELMGIWEPGVVGALAPDATIPSFLDWFPFPAVDGGAGDPTAAMAGGDGMSCLAGSPDACADFLSYMVSTDVQKDYAATTNSAPSNPAAASSLTQPIVAKVAGAAKDCNYTMLWLDTAYGSNVGGAINNNVVALMSGTLNPASFIAAVQKAADAG